MFVKEKPGEEHKSRLTLILKSLSLSARCALRKCVTLWRNGIFTATQPRTMGTEAGFRISNRDAKREREEIKRRATNVSRLNIGSWGRVTAGGHGGSGGPSACTPYWRRGSDIRGCFIRVACWLSDGPG